MKKTSSAKTFFSYVVPSVLAFALSGVYTIVDGLFIGRSLGDIGLAAIALGFPIAAFIQAVGTGIGLAGGIHFTIFGAQNDERKQQNCFSGTAWLLLLLSVLLTAVFFFFAEPLLRLLGAKGEVLAMAAEYVRIIALGAVFQMLATGFVPFIRNMGGATFAMVAMILGFVTNIILDYAFVWVLPWGMAGAAWATIIGQAVTMLAAILFFVRKKRRIGAVPLSELPPLWGAVLKVSLSPFGLTYSSTITLLLMNRFLLIYGNEQSVAIYSCISYITAIIYLLLQGVGDGCQPLISLYYGERKDSDVRQTRRTAYFTAFVISAVCVAVVFLTRTKIGLLFGASASANAGVGTYLPFFLATVLLLSFVRITTSYFYATEKAALSYLLVYAEPACTLVFLLTLPLALKLNGVWMAIPAAQVCAFVIALVAKYYIDYSIKSQNKK